MEQDSQVPATSHTTPIIRYATMHDAPAIARLYQHTTRIAYRGYVPDAVLDTRSLDDLTQLWTSRTGQPPSKERRVLVADAPQTPQQVSDSADLAAIVGFIAIGAANGEQETPATGELHYIFVAPEQWSTGLGRLLIKRATDLLRDDGYRQAILWVFSENKRARRFYEATGWRYDELERPDPVFAAFPHPPLEMRYRINL